MTDLKRLRVLAEEAIAEPYPPRFPLGPRGAFPKLQDYIAAIDPKIFLKLLDVVEAVRDLLSPECNICDPCEVCNAAQLATVEAKFKAVLGERKG